MSHTKLLSFVMVLVFKTKQPMRKVTLAAAAFLVVGLAVQAQSLGPAQALSAGTSGWSAGVQSLHGQMRQ
jgi:hypothetical protein